MKLTYEYMIGDGVDDPIYYTLEDPLKNFTFLFEHLIKAGNNGEDYEPSYILHVWKDNEEGKLYGYIYVDDSWGGDNMLDNNVFKIITKEIEVFECLDDKGNHLCYRKNLDE